MKQFYFMMNFEQDVSRDFYKILDLVKQNNNRDKSITMNNNKKSIDDLFSTLTTFNRNLITITKEDFDDLGIIRNKDNDDDNNCSTDIIDLIANSDCFNMLSITDIDYLISQELSQAEQNNSLVYSKEKTIAFSISKKAKNEIKEVLFNLPPIHYSINKSLEEKALITFGEDQGREMLKGINNSFELTIMKYKTDYNKLVSSLRKEIVDITKKDIPDRIKLKCGNMLFFIKNIDNKLSLNQRLVLDNTPQSDNQLYQLYYKFLEYLYSFKSKQKIILSSYSSEVNELKSTSAKLLLEEINETIDQRKKQIEQYEFDIRKQEMKTQHLKNKEIYDIKQKLKNEKKKLDGELQKKANEKIEQEKRMREEKNKILSEEFIRQKRIKEDNEKERLRIEQELLNKKDREEISLKLPLIQQRQIRSTEQFITQQKKKEIERSKKKFEQQRLNEIIENYKGRPQIEADPDRLIAITQNLQNRYDSIYNNKLDEGDQAKLFSNNGFTVENLMKDFRYKVSSALFEAGIIDKDYSNQMLKDINALHCLNNPNSINSNATSFI